MHGALDHAGFDAPARDLAPDPLQSGCHHCLVLPGTVERQNRAADVRDGGVGRLSAWQ